jgi:hypothetical protein
MVRMIWDGCFEKLFKVNYGLPRLEFEITLSSGDELLVGVTGVLIVITFIVVGGDCDSLGPPLRPPLVISGALFGTLVGGFGRRPSQPPPGAAFPLLYMKTALTASSPVVCLVAMSSSFFMVLGWSRPSSWTRVQKFVPDQNAKMMSASQILGNL